MNLNPLGWLFPSVPVEVINEAYRAHLDRPHVLTLYDDEWNCIASHLMTTGEFIAGAHMEPRDMADFWGIDLALIERAAWGTLADTAAAYPIRPSKENL